LGNEREYRSLSTQKEVEVKGGTTMERRTLQKRFGIRTEAAIGRSNGLERRVESRLSSRRKGRRSRRERQNQGKGEKASRTGLRRLKKGGGGMLLAGEKERKKLRGGRAGTGGEGGGRNSLGGKNR